MEDVKTLTGIVREFDEILIEQDILVNWSTLTKISDKVCDAYAMGKEDANRNK